jgi:hypothetical protein
VAGAQPPLRQAVLGLGEIFGDEVPDGAMIDGLVHHAEIVALKGDSYRLNDRDVARPARDDWTELRRPAGPSSPASPGRQPHANQQASGSRFDRAKAVISASAHETPAQDDQQKRHSAGPVTCGA